MNRKEFLRGVGLASVALTLPKVQLSAHPNPTIATEGLCTLIPSETAGPFPLDLTENTTFFRQDVREIQQGVQLNLRLKILGVNNCEPMQNVRVNIWHCSKEGVYSGYNTGNNPGDANATHLRGYQFTDANGEVEFITVFPGWYNGRICHIHFQVYVSSSYAAVSQLTFPLDAKNALYAANSSVYTKGVDPLSFSGDGIFADGYDTQVATLEANPDTGGYRSYLEVGVQGSGTTGVGHIERETAKVFELGQNFPNPYHDHTVIPVTIKQASHVRLELWDVSGKKVATVLEQYMEIGEHHINVDPSSMGLPTGTYIYQLEARNGNGVFRMPKVMTVRN